MEDSDLGSSIPQARVHMSSATGVCPSHLAFLVTMMVIVLPAAFYLDPLAASMRGHWPDWLREMALVTTHIGKAQWVIVPSGVLLLAAWARHRWTATHRNWVPSVAVRVSAYLFATVGAAEVLSSLLKGLFGRARPFLVDDAGAFVLHPIALSAPYLSFPSGHATSVSATCMALWLLCPATRWFTLPAALWLGATRVIGGAHYPSDVIVGLVLGAYLALTLALIFERRGILAFPGPAYGRLR